MGLWGPVIVVLAVAVVLRLVLEWLEARRRQPLPFRRVDSLLTPAERQFAEVLREAAGGRHLILAKVRLADLVRIEARGTAWWQAWGRVSNKHVDFLLADPGTWAPRAVIELDDASHRRPDRRRRDALVMQICQAAGLPLLRVPVRRQWEVEDVARQVEQVMRAADSPAARGRGGHAGRGTEPGAR